MGNEAIAQGFIEAGGGFASAYPGTPSTEIVETLSEIANSLGIYVEWSVNEKVALESAYGASISNVRALAAMKHVGLNVAADALASISYTGVKSGLVIVSAEDPSIWSSQNEQDNRYYGMLTYVPVFDPSDPQEAKDLTKAAFDLSEKLSHPILMTPTTRVSHTRSNVILDEIKPPKTKGFFLKDNSRFGLVPANSRTLRDKLINKWSAIKESLENFEPYNRIENIENGKVAIIASGVSYQYTKEVLNEIGNYRLIKISTPYTLPKNSY
jgi:indolepyruvate ferredoxin oxidoreductase alpha subunit